MIVSLRRERVGVGMSFMGGGVGNEGQVGAYDFVRPRLALRSMVTVT